MGRHKTIITDLEKLSTRADECILQDEENLNQTIKWIKDILYSKKDLVSLAAPQIGVNARLFCIKFDGGDIRTFINPMIKSSKGLHLSRESCISIPNKEYIVPRNDEIEVVYQTPIAKIEENIMRDAVGEVFQQMCQLLDGLLISDFGLEIVDEWDSATEEERQEVINAYLDGLKLSSDGLNKAIDQDEDAKKLKNAIDYLEQVQEGKVELYKEEPHLNREQRRQLEKIKKKIKRANIGK